MLNRSQPDFTLINLPTGLRLPKWKSAFRVTHRFTRPLGDGDFGDLAGDFFGLDSGAVIGLEFRIGIVPGGQVGIHRTNDKTIQFFGQYDLKQQSESFPLGLAAYASIDGTNNFRDSYSPALGADRDPRVRRARRRSTSSRSGSTTPTRCRPSVVDDNDTFLLGVGGRIRVRPTVYVVGEIVPRAQRLRPEEDRGQLRHREARRRPRLPADLLEHLRPDHGADRARRRAERRRRQQLVHGLQHLAQVLLAVKAGGRARGAGGLAGAGPPACFVC